VVACQTSLGICWYRGVAVTLQLDRRILLQIPYLVVGTGLSDVSLTYSLFPGPMYDPILYQKLSLVGEQRCP